MIEASLEFIQSQAGRGVTLTNDQFNERLTFVCELAQQLYLQRDSLVDQLARERFSSGKSLLEDVEDELEITLDGENSVLEDYFKGRLRWSYTCKYCGAQLAGRSCVHCDGED